MEDKKAVGIWIRVSTEDQAMGDAPEHHEKRARLYAEAKGWEVRKVYHLEAVSGKTVMQHPEAQKMLRDIKNGYITGLIFSKLARLARNTRELLDFSDLFQAANADLISLQEAIDTSSPAGRLFYTMIAAMAQWEREEIASRVAASVPIRAKLGKPLGGQASFGYKWEGKELVIDKKEAPIRKLIYELFKEHKRKGTVADVLNKQGYRTRNGSEFSDTTIGRLLHDPTAKGQRRANYTKNLGEGKNWEMKPQSEWVLIPCPAIVTAELWNECEMILNEQEQKSKRPTKKAVHLFTGILICECGANMYIGSNSKKYVCQKCKQNRIDANDIEEIYFNHLKTFLMTGEDLETFISKADGIIKDKINEMEVLAKQGQKVKSDMDKLVALHLAGEMPKEGFNNYFMPLQEQLDQIEKSLPEIQGGIDLLKIQRLNGDHMLYEAKNLCERWPSFSTEGKRTIVEQVTSSIVMGGEQIHIKFSYTPQLSGNAPESQHIPMDSYLPPT